MALSQSLVRAASISTDVTQRATPELEGLVGIGITIQAAPGQTIVLEGDPCGSSFRVLTGAVRLHKGTPDGRRQLIDFLVAGDCFGLIGSHYSYGVEAITQSTLVRVSRAAVSAAVREQPRIAERLIERAAAELARAHEHMLLLGRKNAQEKVRPAFRLPISRQEIADNLGLTVETVSRTMTRLRQKGFIALPTPHNVEPLHPTELAALAEGTA
jgi:CRP/FNR family transcriptional regulator, anaerobic regulatory protein